MKRAEEQAFASTPAVGSSASPITDLGREYGKALVDGLAWLVLVFDSYARSPATRESDIHGAHRSRC